MCDRRMNPSVTSECIDGITVVTLNRPDVRNAVDADTARDLHAAFLAYDDDPASRVAVFHGAHGHFCAGWDLQAGARLHAAGVDGKALIHLDWAPDAERPLGPMGPSRLLLSKPVIAAVSGAAVAGGMELALWCDLRVMEADAYFGVYCRRFGVPLIDGGTVRLPRLVGEGRALDIILTGRKVTAEEALRIGACERVVPDGSARQAAEALAVEIARFPQRCVRADRQSVYLQQGLSEAEGLRSEWWNSKEVLKAEGIAGATRFSGGQGRHGSFER